MVERLEKATAELKRLVDGTEPENLVRTRFNEAARRMRTASDSEFKLMLSGGNRITRGEILARCRGLVKKAKKTGDQSILKEVLLFCGTVESRVNHRVPLTKAQREVLGIGAVKVEGQDDRQGIHSERAPGQLSMHRAERQSFASSKTGSVIQVSKAEILRKTAEAVRRNKLDLVTAGIIEQRLNVNSKVPEEILRMLFE